MVEIQSKPEDKSGGKPWKAIVIIAIIGILWAFWPSDEEMAESKRADAAAQTSQLLAKRSSAEKVTARAMFDAYQANEVAAQARYKDKVIEISGVVAGINSDMGDEPVVLLETSNQFMPARIGLGEDQVGFAAGLGKGQKVSFVCGRATEVIGTPSLTECIPVD